MTDKQLKKLKRVELLELLVEQSTEMEALRKKLDEAERALERRELNLNTAGSIAEAALRVNEVFDAAERAAKDYVDSVQMLKARQETLLLETERRCKAMLRQAETEADKRQTEGPTT